MLVACCVVLIVYPQGAMPFAFLGALLIITVLAALGMVDVTTIRWKCPIT